MGNPAAPVTNTVPMAGSVTPVPGGRAPTIIWPGVKPVSKSIVYWGGAVPSSAGGSTGGAGSVAEA